MYPKGERIHGGARSFSLNVRSFTSVFPAILATALLAGAAVVAAQSTATKAPREQGPTVTTIHFPPVPKPLLPTAFDGWVQVGKPVLSRDPAQIDASGTAALKEYGFSYGEVAQYTRDADETLSMRALHFDDTSGTYGAYSFYRRNGWAREDIGAGAASDHNRVLFWKGNTVVDANFSHIGPMTAGEMRSIASHLPEPRGNKALAPPILAFLPSANLVQRTTHYALGAAGYAGGDGVLPTSLVGFDMDAETVTANYSLASGPATLTIIEYPTPQIAQAQEKMIRDYIQAGVKSGGKGTQPPWTKALQNSDQASLEVRRSGLLVVVVSGDAIPDESHRLIEMVHYEADLTAIPQPVESEAAKTGRLLLGIAVIVIVGSLAAILLGFFLGGGRAIWRIAHGKPASSVYDEEFIHLDLTEKLEEESAIHRQNPER